MNINSALDHTDHNYAIANQSTSQSAEEDRHIEPEYGNKQEEDDGDDDDDYNDDDDEKETYIEEEEYEDKEEANAARVEEEDEELYEEEDTAHAPEENDEPEEEETEEEAEEEEDEEEEEYDDEDYDENYDDEDYGDEAEEEETTGMDQEAELLYRSYEILSGFYKTHFVDLRVLDSSCEPSEVPPPTIMHAHVQEYRTTENILVPGQHYHEVIYKCDPGYKLTDQGKGHMFCQQKGWMGIEPYCEEDPDNKNLQNFDDGNDNYKISEEERCENDQGCDHMCRMVDSVPTCECREGYRLEDVTLCLDIDECLVNNGDCEHECVNKPGTYTCSCPSGYRVDGIRCIDMNECTSNNGHGPCQDTCVNTEGGFQCSCDNIPGTTLDTDGNNCVEIDLCQENNGNCSHECLTSYGQSFCTCPEGYKLDIDYKTCIDTDECESMEIILETCGPNAGCINTDGSFECIDLIEEDDGIENAVVNEKNENTVSVSNDENNDITEDGKSSAESEDKLCSEGYIFDENSNVCIDVNECDEQIDICGRNGRCVNQAPGYQCDCGKGFQFDGVTCVDIDECQDRRACKGKSPRLLNNGDYFDIKLLSQKLIGFLLSFFVIFFDRQACNLRQYTWIIQVPM